jgi:hypothetical protein
MEALLPQGANPQRSLRLDGIVGSDANQEKVGSTHPLRHRESGRQFGFLSRFQGRRTDDRFGRSASLRHLDRWRGGQLERLITHIFQTKPSLDVLPISDRAEID